MILARLEKMLYRVLSLSNTPDLGFFTIISKDGTSYQSRLSLPRWTIYAGPTAALLVLIAGDECCWLNISTARFQPDDELVRTISEERTKHDLRQHRP